LRCQENPYTAKEIPVTTTLSTRTASAEAELIRSAQAGNEQAMAELFETYQPAINAAAYRFANRLGFDDAKQAASIGFLNAVAAFDADRPSGATRLAVLLGQYMTEEMWTAVADNGLIRVPSRSLKRYFQILRAANNDLAVAEALAPKYDMRAETFAAVAVAVNPGLAYDAEVLDRPAATRYAAVEDQVLSSAALGSCSPDERAVLELHYGIGAYESLPLSEVAAQLGMSQRLVRKMHASGLAAAREALGAL
jgi:RNA polymerase sigma factor (sigma-70 family)